MTKPNSSKAVEELIASVRSNVEVIRDAMKAPATEDSHAIVSDLMLEVKTNQDKLQKKASEMAETGQFGSTNEIFEAIDQVSNLEPQFEDWSKSAHRSAEDQIGANIHVEEEAPEKSKKKKKKKKSKREDENVDDDAVVTPPQAPAPVVSLTSTGWEAFPPAPGMNVQSAATSVVGQATWPTSSVASHPVTTGSPSIAPVYQPGASAEIPPPAANRAKLTLGMTWDMIGPLLGDPGSSDEVRKQRLADLMKEAIANECGINQARIRIRNIS